MPTHDRGQRFAGYGESSLDIDLMAYVTTDDWNDFFAIREDVFLRIKEIVMALGTQFALPSRTLYVGWDKGLNDEDNHATMDEIAVMRESINLPFPHHTPERLADIDVTLDYPPRGSVDEKDRESQHRCGGLGDGVWLRHKRRVGGRQRRDRKWTSRRCWRISSAWWNGRCRSGNCPKAPPRR